jgi:hypothetical protein
MKYKKIYWVVIIILIIGLIYFYKGGKLTTEMDFKTNFQRRVQVVQEIKNGNLKNNIDYNKSLIHLPSKYSGLSSGGNDIIFENKDGKLNVLFFTVRGVTDNFAGIIYKEDNAHPNPDNFNCGTLLESTKLDENWFWMSCT